MSANMSVLGLYNYDTSIFSNMAFPTGFTAQDKTDLVDNLLMELAELEVIYTDPAFFKMAVEKWSKKEVGTWNRIYSASLLEYNPIENYDRQEAETEVTDGSRQHSGTDTVTNSGTDTTTNSGTDTVTNSGTDTVTNSGKDTTQDSGSDSSSGTGSKGTTRTGADTTTNQIAGYDSGTLVTHDTSELAFASGVSETTTDSTTVTHGKKSELTHGHVEATQHGHVEATLHGHVEATQHGLQSATLHGEKIDDDITRNKMSRIHGNIGVTTSQQMLQQEIDIAPKLNIMNYIIDSFKNRFCIMVW